MFFTGLLRRHLSWVFLNKNRYSQKMQNCLFPKCLSPIAFSHDSCSLLIVLKICKFFTLSPTNPSLILKHPFYSQKNEDIGWGDSQFFTGRAQVSNHFSKLDIWICGNHVPFLLKAKLLWKLGTKYGAFSFFPCIPYYLSKCKTAFYTE